MHTWTHLFRPPDVSSPSYTALNLLPPRGLLNQTNSTKPRDSPDIHHDIHKPVILVSNFPTTSVPSTLPHPQLRCRFVRTTISSASMDPHLVQFPPPFCPLPSRRRSAPEVNQENSTTRLRGRTSRIHNSHTSRRSRRRWPHHSLLNS